MLVEKFGVFGNVCFYGFCCDIYELIQFVDVFVVLSIREGFGMNVFEGMVVEKLVIVMDNCGYWEIIWDGENGFLIKIGDSVVFVCWIEQFYYKLEFCKKLGQEG